MNADLIEAVYSTFRTDPEPLKSLKNIVLEVQVINPVWNEKEISKHLWYIVNSIGDILCYEEGDKIKDSLFLSCEF